MQIFSRHFSSLYELSSLIKIKTQTLRKRTEYGISRLLFYDTSTEYAIESTIEYDIARKTRHLQAHIDEVIESMLHGVDDSKRRISHRKCRKPMT